MNISILITGGKENEREQKSLSIAKEVSSDWDTKLFDARLTNGIADIKAFIQDLHSRPFNSAVQSAVIIEAQNLTVEAQTALLKTLEEPAETTRIILTAPTAQSLLSTVVSRCGLIELPVEKHTDDKKGNLEPFLAQNFYKRWEKAENLDINIWTAFWRNRLHDSILREENSPEKVKKLLNYLKLINKAKSLEKRRVSKKLLNTFLLLSPPLKEL